MYTQNPVSIQALFRLQSLTCTIILQGVAEQSSGAPLQSGHTESRFPTHQILLDSLSIYTAKSNMQLSSAALSEVSRQVATPSCSLDLGMQEAMGSKLEALAKSAPSVLEKSGPAARQDLVPTWLFSLLKILDQAQTCFPSCAWPRFQFAQNGLREAVTLHLSKSDGRTQDELLGRINSMPPISQALQSPTNSQLHSASVLRKRGASRWRQSLW